MMVLPQNCPECGVWLQRALDPGAGVKPHFDYCHPGLPAPAVAS